MPTLSEVCFEVGDLVDRLRGVPLRFTTGNELTLGEVLGGASIPERAIATDVPVLDEHCRSWMPPGYAVHLWAAPAGATSHLRAPEADANLLLVGLAGAIECVVVPGRSDASAIGVEEMTKGAREALLAFAEGVTTRVAPGRGVSVPAKSFVFLEWLERGAFLVLRRSSGG